MFFSWLKSRRRRRLLATPLPNEWLQIVQSNVPHYHSLEVAQQRQLQDDVRIFIAEKNWEGCSGLELTAEIKVTIAALACLLLLGLEHDYFSSVLSILVYPTSYAVPESREHSGQIIEGHSRRFGEAWYRGPVILSWQTIRRDLAQARSGHNLVWHEFAHQLDFLDRATDGTPPLENRQQYRQWQEVMSREFERLIADSRAGRETLLDTYGTTNEAEFFAVATECFFDRGPELKAEIPSLYELLQQYYHQNPAAWELG